MRDDEDIRWETETRGESMKRRDPRDTAEFHVSYAAHAVSLAINDIVNLSKVYPHLVREELATLANANDDLACLVAKFTVVREAAE